MTKRVAAIVGVAIAIALTAVRGLPGEVETGERCAREVVRAGQGQAAA